MTHIFRIIFCLISFLSFNAQAMQRIWETCEDFFVYDTANQMDDWEERTRAIEAMNDDDKIRYQHSWDVCTWRAWQLGSGFAKAGAASAVSYGLMSQDGFLTFAGILGFAFKNNIENQMASFQKALWPDEAAKKLDELELKLKLVARKIPEMRYEMVAQDLKCSRARIMSASSSFGGYGVQDDMGKTRELKRIEMVLDLPTEIKSHSLIDSYSVSGKIEEAMSTYDPILVNQIKLLAFEIMNAESPDNDGRSAVPRSAYYFLGVPGTGKSATAKLLADVTGQSMCTIDLSKIEPAELFGAKPQSENSRHNLVVKAGKIAQCFLRSKTLRPIIFIDEVHDALDPRNKAKSLQYQSALKEILDGGKKYIEDEQLGIIDMSHAIIIFAANRMPEDTEGALMNRLMRYIFKPAITEHRAHIARKAFNSARARFSNLRVEENSESVFAEVDEENAYSGQDILSDSDKQIYEDIVVFDAKHCQKEGVRALQKVIAQFARFLSARKSKAIDVNVQFNVEAEYECARSKSLVETSANQLVP